MNKSIILVLWTLLTLAVIMTILLTDVLQYATNITKAFTPNSTRPTAISHAPGSHDFVSMPFEVDKLDCVVKALKNTTSLRQYTRNTSLSKPPCTLSRFHEYFLETSQFYGEGAWYTPTVNYMPKDCSFTNFTGAGTTLKQCIAQKQITRILLTGDSTARYLHPNMVRLFAGWNCTKPRLSHRGLKIYNSASEVQYFSVPKVPPEILEARTCGFNDISCYSWESMCTTAPNLTVYIEYISMLRIVDSTLRVKRKGAPDFTEASDKLEYILKYYLPHRGYPDIWLYKIPFRHETWWSTPKHVRVDLTYALELLALYSPKSTRLVILPDSRECPVKLSGSIKKHWSKWSKTGFKTSRNVALHNCNQILYDTFRGLVDKFTNAYAFLDDMRLTCDMMCDFQRDAAHYTDPYYSNLFRYVIESTCAQS